MDTASDVITLLDILKGAIMNIGRRISRILMLLGNQPSVKGYQYIKRDRILHARSEVSD